VTRYLLDTNIISEPARVSPNPRVVESLEAARGQLALPSIVWHELVFGVERLPASHRRHDLERYLFDVVRTGCELLPYDAEAAAWHARERVRLERLGRPAPFVDGQIAAIAVTRAMTLVTRNRKDFVLFRGIETENWFEGDGN
jgi:tRNA(fMet)-specific endonuclease VapC